MKHEHTVNKRTSSRCLMKISKFCWIECQTLNLNKRNSSLDLMKRSIVFWFTHIHVAQYKIKDEMEPNNFYDLDVHLVVIAANLDLCSTLLVIEYIKFFKRVTSMVKRDFHVLGVILRFTPVVERLAAVL